ncbi:MAG: ATP-binding cassette domain-containing protein [Anaerolineae bacterium]|nr:ATP-binding cassette domain-containing protein [Anaerolineae bacterium]
MPKDWHGKKVALLPQRALNSLNPTARVRNIVIDVVRAHSLGVPPEEAVQRARERLEQLSLPVRVLDNYPHQLSGGMRQRVVAVISTLLNPKVLIADEPTSALDVSSQKQLVLLLEELLERGFIACIVYITHDLPMLSTIADRIAVMYAGKIAEIGTTQEIVDRAEHPYTQALIGSTLDLDPEMRGRQIKGGSRARRPTCVIRRPAAGSILGARMSWTSAPKRSRPSSGDETRFAACWWVQEKKAQQVSSVEGATL